MSGQPSVENGHRPEENHVSSTDSSCLSFVPPHLGQARGASRDTIISPQSQYHAGMRCPHQSCREMHQSRMFSIQLKYVFSYRCGTNFTSPLRTASSAGSASVFIATNHCSEISGSTTVWQRWHMPTLWL